MISQFFFFFLGGGGGVLRALLKHLDWWRACFKKFPRDYTCSHTNTHDTDCLNVNILFAYFHDNRQFENRSDSFPLSVSHSCFSLVLKNLSVSTCLSALLNIKANDSKNHFRSQRKTVFMVV